MPSKVRLDTLKPGDLFTLDGTRHVVIGPFHNLKLWVEVGVFWAQTGISTDRVTDKGLKGDNMVVPSSRKAKVMRRETANGPEYSVQLV